MPLQSAKKSQVDTRFSTRIPPQGVYRMHWTVTVLAFLTVFWGGFWFGVLYAVMASGQDPSK